MKKSGEVVVAYLDTVIAKKVKQGVLRNMHPWQEERTKRSRLNVLNALLPHHFGINRILNYLLYLFSPPPKIPLPLQKLLLGGFEDGHQFSGPGLMGLDEACGEAVEKLSSGHRAVRTGTAKHRLR